MIDKNCKIVIQKAANGYITRLNDNGQPFVFSTEEQVVEWFKNIILPDTVRINNSDKKEVFC